MTQRIDRSKHAACGMPVALGYPAVGMVSWLSRSVGNPFIAGGSANLAFATAP
jgi:hypothetical protein